MPQGKLKTKVSVPKSAKKKGQRQSKTKQVLRKGGKLIFYTFCQQSNYKKIKVILRSNFNYGYFRKLECVRV